MKPLPMRSLKEALVSAPVTDRVVTLLKHPRLLNTNFDYRKSVCLAGAGRSGTTWVANILNYDKRYRDMFEPFDATYVPMAARFFSGLYLQPENDNPEYLEPAKTIIAGKVGNRRIDAGNVRLFRQERMIKEIRGNLWLKWLRNHFPEMPIIWLIRHPCAVASSRLELDWSTYIPQFLAQRDLMEDHLEPLHEHIASASSDFEKHVFAWCIQHYVPLRQLAQGDVHVVFYEHLCVDTPMETARLFAFLRRRYDERALRRAALPSNTDWRNAATEPKRGKELAASWRRRISADQLQAAVKVLELFGLDAIYGEDPLPKVTSLESFFGATHWQAGYRKR